LRISTSGGLRCSSPPTLVTMAHGQGGAEIAEDRAPTLTCNHEAPILFHGGCFDDVTHTLRAEGFDASEDGTGRGTPLIAVPFRNSRRAQSADDRETWVPDDVTNTLKCFDVGDIRAVDIIAFPQNLSGTQCASTENLSPAMGSTNPTAVASESFGVRRLTPRECERLQGFPDDYTLVPICGKERISLGKLKKRKGKMAADGPRYKQLGNSMAVPAMEWIGKRIAEQLAQPRNSPG
jgi:DNA (cytosine-5)-methyltransferase 1